MARPKRNPLAVEDLKRHVDRLAKRKPGTPDQIRLYVYKTRDITIGEETIRRALEGQVDPTQCQVELLLALCAWYEVTPAELGKFAEQKLAPVLAMAHQFPGPDTPGDLGIAGNRWGMESPACGVASIEKYLAAKADRQLAPAV